MHLRQHKLCTRNTEVALEIQFYLDFHQVYVAMATTAGQWRWRDMYVSAVSPWTFVTAWFTDGVENIAHCTRTYHPRKLRPWTQQFHDRTKQSELPTWILDQRENGLVWDVDQCEANLLQQQLHDFGRKINATQQSGTTDLSVMFCTMNAALIMVIENCSQWNCHWIILSLTKKHTGAACETNNTQEKTENIEIETYDKQFTTY